MFWGQITYIYTGDGSQIYSESKDFSEANGFKPIYVNATSVFRDNNKVFQYAFAQYRVNGYWYADTGSVVEKTSDWIKGVSFNY